MMRLEIEQIDGEQPVVLSLVDTADGDVIVPARKGRDTCHGNLLIFRKDGTIDRRQGINELFGFQLNSKGRIKETE